MVFYSLATGSSFLVYPLFKKVLLWWIYSIMILSAVQESGSVKAAHTSVLFLILFTHRLLQSVG